MARGIFVTLEKHEKEALLALASDEKRHPSAQGAQLVRQALEDKGYLHPILPPYASRADRIDNMAWKCTHGEMTLEAAAKEFGVSRERIRTFIASWKKRKK